MWLRPNAFACVSIGTAGCLSQPPMTIAAVQAAIHIWAGRKPPFTASSSVSVSNRQVVFSALCISVSNVFMEAGVRRHEQAGTNRIPRAVIAITSCAVAQAQYLRYRTR